VARALTICGTHGCGEPVVRGKCAECARAEARERRRRRPRGESSPYDSRWRARRARYLREHEHCECEDCLRIPKAGRPVATDVHHVRGVVSGEDERDEDLLALAHGHHSRETARLQPGGFNAFAKRERVVKGRV
jgi:hypothetical protein